MGYVGLQRMQISERANADVNSNTACLCRTPLEYVDDEILKLCMGGDKSKFECNAHSLEDPLTRLLYSAA